MAPHAEHDQSPSLDSLHDDSRPGALPENDETIGEYRGYDHVHWYVGNAKQAVTYYTARMGFHLVAYKGLDTGSRAVASYVLRNGDVTFVLSSPLRTAAQAEDPADQDLLASMADHLIKHGDAVKDVAFEVDSVDQVYHQALARGAVSVSAPQTISDKDGAVKTAAIQAYGETIHTLVERKAYHGLFLPGYRAPKDSEDPLNAVLPSIDLEAIDHCVGNQDWNAMDEICA
jgi:4-hydroxyphenylpyruvate dioxygenase